MLRKNVTHTLLAILINLLALAGCNSNNPVATVSDDGSKAFVLNSISNSISVINLDSLIVQNDVIELGANSSAVGFSVRGNRALVPNGIANNALLIDLDNLSVIGTIDLPVGSGATGSAFLDDNTAFVCNLNLASVVRIDLRSMSVTDTIDVGQVPGAVAVANGKVFVVNANIDLITFQSIGNGTISVIDPVASKVTKTIDTGATNSQFVSLDNEGDLIVVNTGQYGAANGSISVIDPDSETLTAGPFTIGDGPGEIGINSVGVAYIASFSAGLYSFDATTNTVLRNAGNALAALTSGGKNYGAAGMDFDDNGNIYSVNFGDAATPGTVFVFDANETLVDSVKVGIGPFSIVIP